MMKKKYLSLLFVTILLLVLSGCGACEHEWTDEVCLTPVVCKKCEAVREEIKEHEWQDATCDSGKSCTYCGAVEGEALGHDWKEATCIEASSCNRCGETKGEALGHTYGSWTIDQTEMYRLCETCGTEDRTEIDREVFLRTLLTGHWELSYKLINGKRYTAENMAWERIGCYVSVKEDDSLIFYDEEKLAEGTWKFVSYEETSKRYKFTAVMEDERELSFELEETPEGGVLYYFLNPYSYVAMERNQQVADAMIGLWAAVHEAQIYTIEFAADRTFTAKLDREITGTWQLQPIVIYRGYRYGFMSLNCEWNGKKRVIPCDLSLGSEARSLEESLKYADFSMWLQDSGKSPRFSKVMGEMLSDAEELLAEDPADRIAGMWTSKFVRSSGGNGTSTSEINTDYKLTIHADGTYQLSFNGESSGTWKVLQTNFGTGYLERSYELLDTRTKRYNYMYIDSNSEGLVYIDQTNGYREIAFGKLNEEDIAIINKAPERLPGEYISAEDDYTLSVNADGTFTVILDKPFSGTWYISGYDTDDQAFEVRVQFDETGEEFGSRLKKDGTMYFLCRIDGSLVVLELLKK